MGYVIPLLSWFFFHKYVSRWTFHLGCWLAGCNSDIWKTAQASHRGMTGGTGAHTMEWSWQVLRLGTHPDRSCTPCTWRKKIVSSLHLWWTNSNHRFLPSSTISCGVALTTELDSSVSPSSLRLLVDCTPTLLSRCRLAGFRSGLRCSVTLGHSRGILAVRSDDDSLRLTSSWREQTRTIHTNLCRTSSSSSLFQGRLEWPFLRTSVGRRTLYMRSKCRKQEGRNWVRGK